jgi:hypothetical protein
MRKRILGCARCRMLYYKVQPIGQSAVVLCMEFANQAAEDFENTHTPTMPWELMDKKNVPMDMDFQSPSSPTVLMGTMADNRRW